MDKIGDQLPAVAITAASLTLVFLGFLLTSWDGYDAQGKNTVRPKYRIRGWLGFAGFLAALVSVLLGFVGIGTGHVNPCVDWAGLGFLAAWAALVVAQCIIALKEIG